VIKEKVARRICRSHEQVTAARKEGISLCREVIRRQDLRLGFKLMISVAGQRRLMDPQQGLPGDGMWLGTAELTNEGRE